MLKKFDFLVNGGGLVGCLTSLVLSKKNYSVCLIEKNNFKKIISDSYIPLSLTINSVEFPSLYLGSFDKSYLKLPTSFLVAVISGKQNYFSFTKKSNNWFYRRYQNNSKL